MYFLPRTTETHSIFSKKEWHKAVDEYILKALKGIYPKIPGVNL